MTDTLDLPALNVPLLRDVVTWAAADHEHLTNILDLRFPGWGKWEQGNWARGNGVCQTAYCIAGQAAHQVGYIPIMEGLTATACAPKVFDRLVNGVPTYKPADVDVRNIADLARESLGLTHEEASALFNGDNGIGTIVALALGFAKVRGVDLGLSFEVQELAAGESPFDPTIVWFPPEYRAALTGRCEACGQEVPA